MALLHGVTGSGKTEIYLRLAERARRAGRQTLLMVPEIALTPSVAALFRSAFGDRVAIQHSGLSDGERHDQWHRIRRGDVDVVVGTRSAVFAPLTRVGVIVVDEEHDTSYKQEEAPRYHGRDVADRARPRREGAGRPRLGDAVDGELPARALGQVRQSDARAARAGPAARIGPPRQHAGGVRRRGTGRRDLARARAAIEDRLQRQEQVLVLLNRRGYATAVFCRQCGDTFECPNCTISLTVHTAPPGLEGALPLLQLLDDGAEGVPQVRGAVSRAGRLRDREGRSSICASGFPAARIGRVDRDSVRRKGALTSLLSRFAAGELDVLVGTQMIAKGHDFPRVTLVGVISADVGLGVADFRAGERTFQLLTQVAGRAGRGERAGEAVVQTLYPEHYSIQLACRQDYAAFFERELAFRRGMRYPPTVALVNVVVRGRSFDEAMRTASDVVRRLKPFDGARRASSILGPAPAPLVRLSGEHRVQFFLKGARRADMRNALKAVLAEMPEVRRKITVDVDPLNVL